MSSLTLLCYILILQVFSCHGKKAQIETPKPVFIGQHEQKLENFVFLVKESHGICIDDGEESCQEKEPIMPLASASGVILSSSSSHIFIITANHFCETSDIEKMMGEVKIRVFIGESKRLANIITYSESADLCLLQGLRYKGENFEKTKLANSMPLIGEKLTNVAAPDGMASPNTRLMFDGIFSGCEGLNCVFTIPATFGSSGSAVYNENGELVSILVAAAVNFENVSMGPHITTIQTLVETVDEEIDIY